MDKKIEEAKTRLAEVEKELGRSDILSNQEEYRKLTQEHAHLKQLTEVGFSIQRLKKDLVDNKSLLKDEQDPDMVSMIQETIEKDKKRLEELESQLESLLVPPDPDDNKTTIIELRAGTGGAEAALFVADCVRMYQNFANAMGWNVEALSASPSDLGGYKEYIMSIAGKGVHRYLQYESGTHRVQRIPETETQGRVHTSAITIAIMAEPDEDDDIELLEKDLRIDTFRASGAGGQHVNTTDSAVRITHIPTGAVSYCMQERSQHKNKEKAMRLLKAKIAEEKKRKLARERSDIRSQQIGSGDRSERIRTYNFPQNRLTEHRINLTKYNLDQIIAGDLEEITSALISYFHAQKMENA